MMATTGGSRGVGRPTGSEGLRTTLLDAALRLLEESNDPREVTVAAIVEAADCTPPSLYHYWPTREELLRDASLRGWAVFRNTQLASVREDAEVLDRIRSRGNAYLAFALERPSLFRVLFLDRQVPGLPQPDPAQPGAALTELIVDVSRAMNEGLFRRGDPLTVALALWASVHGVAALWVSAPMPRKLAWDLALEQQDALIAGFGAR